MAKNETRAHQRQFSLANSLVSRQLSQSLSLSPNQHSKNR
jgi:hypothetical protein